MTTHTRSSQPGRRPLPEDERKVITSVLLPPEQRDRIKRLANETGLRQSDVMRQLLDLGVTRFKRKHRVD